MKFNLLYEVWSLLYENLVTIGQVGLGKKSREFGLIDSEISRKNFAFVYLDVNKKHILWPWKFVAAWFMFS